MRAAAYLRVSTDGQTNENQRLAVEEHCKARGWTLVRTYEETASGAAVKRQEYDRMRRDAANGRGAGWDVLVVYRLDRLTRGGALAALDALAQLDKAGRKVSSVSESWLDTAGPFREVLIAFAAAVAKMERETLIERTRAGLARARAEGTRLGRPPAAEASLVAAAGNCRWTRRGWTGTKGRRLVDVAKAFGVSESTLRRFLRKRGY